MTRLGSGSILAAGVDPSQEKKPNFLTFIKQDQKNSFALGPGHGPPLQYHMVNDKR